MTIGEVAFKAYWMSKLGEFDDTKHRVETVWEKSSDKDKADWEAAAAAVAEFEG
jgi:hypothetical protein